jgi:hypothetical protein
MIDRFLKAKHWQIFTVTIGLPFLIQIVLIPITIMGNDPMIMMKMFPIIMILFCAIYGWLWSIAIGLQQVIPVEFKLNVNKFKIFFLISIVYMILILIFFMSIINLDGPNPGIFAVIVPIHLFSMFCLIYSLYFVAKTFKSAELQRKVTFSDFAGEFFMIWFFPIGIWIIQPKVNKLVESRD